MIEPSSVSCRRPVALCPGSPTRDGETDCLCRPAGRAPGRLSRGQGHQRPETNLE